MTTWASRLGALSFGVPTSCSGTCELFSGNTCISRFPNRAWCKIMLLKYQSHAACHNTSMCRCKPANQYIEIAHVCLDPYKLIASVSQMILRSAGNFYLGTYSILTATHQQPNTKQPFDKFNSLAPHKAEDQLVEVVKFLLRGVGVSS